MACFAGILAHCTEKSLCAKPSENMSAGGKVPPASGLPQAVKQSARRESIGNFADRRLEIADGEPGPRTEQAVGLAGVETAPRQQLLHLVALIERENTLLARPRLHERSAAAQPIGKMADRERIGLGGIVFHDDAEILQHQKCGSAGACRHQQIGAGVGLAERSAAGAAYA